MDINSCIYNFKQGQVTLTNVQVVTNCLNKFSYLFIYTTQQFSNKR